MKKSETGGNSIMYGRRDQAKKPQNFQQWRMYRFISFSDWRPLKETA